MDPIQALDHYRLPVLSSRKSVLLLALLLRDGPMTLPEISASLDADPVETDRLLIRIFRAALVEQRAVDLWAVSDLGKRVLEALRIPELASVDLAEAIVDAPVHRLFVKDWFELGREEWDSQTRLSLLRSLNHCKPLLEFGVRRQEFTSLLYAVLIAANPWVRETGSDEAAKVLSHRLGSFLPTDSEPRKNFDLDAVRSNFKTGLRIYRDSNRFLLFVPLRSPRTTKRALRFSWLRALDAALEGKADQGLSTACGSWHRDDASTFWQLAFKEPFLERHSRTLLEQYSGIVLPSAKALREELTERLLEAIAGSKTISRLEIALAGPIETDEVEKLVLFLKTTSMRIRQGAEPISEPKKKILLAALSALQADLTEEGRNRPTEVRSNKGTQPTARKTRRG